MITDLDKTFYVRAVRADGTTNLATGIQVIVPENMNYYDARRYIIGRVTEEVVKYFAAECARACGLEP